MGKGLFIAIGVVAVAGVAATVYLVNQRKKFQNALLSEDYTGTVISGGNAVAETSTVFSRGTSAQAMMIPAYRPGSRPDITSGRNVSQVSSEIPTETLSAPSSISERPET